MNHASPTQSHSALLHIFFSLLGFRLSEKMKFALKTSVSIVLVYLISFWQGWQSPSTSAITIALIASVDSLSDSFTKGALRVIGTLSGAIIGLWLIALYPQERMLYLLSASIGVTLFFYLARIYRGDTTVFFLTGMTMLLVFQDNNAQDAFLYGINRTYMTLFGIAVYTFVGILLWPVTISHQADNALATLSQTQHALFSHAEDPEQREQYLAQLLQHEQALQRFAYHTLEMPLSRLQWLSIVESYHHINESLLLYLNTLSLLQQREDSFSLKHHQQSIHEIHSLFQAIPLFLESAQPITLPKPLALEDIPKEDSSLLTHAHRVALSQYLHRLHHALRELALKLEKSQTIHPLSSTQTQARSTPSFHWGDPEALKGSLITFLVFWASTFAWIFFTPPLGFFLVIMATSFSFLTAFSPLKPSLLMILYTLSFVFAIFSYIVVLPHLNGAWELALFLFVYSFIAFYFIDLKASLFFIIALSTLNITNNMVYAFDIFLLILLFFYLFLLLLMLFYYLPFSTKPEVMYMTMQKRFFTLLEHYLKKGHQKREAPSQREQLHLQETIARMQLWASQIDQRYFSTFKTEKATAFFKSCQRSTYLFHAYLSQLEKEQKNPLLAHLNPLVEVSLQNILLSLKKERFNKEEYCVEASLEEAFQKHFKRENEARSTPSEQRAFFTLISLQHSLFRHLKQTKKRLQALKTQHLKESRF